MGLCRFSKFRSSLPGHRVHRPTVRAGFTLIEAALTTVIVGTGVLSIVAAQQAYTRKNDWASRTGTAALLANEIRELTLTLPAHDPLHGAGEVGPGGDETTVGQYDDVDDFAGVVDAFGKGAGVTITPPINALRLPIADLTGWSQLVKVDSVLEDNISSTYTQPLNTTPMLRVTVQVRYQSPGEAQPSTLTELVWVVNQ